MACLGVAPSCACWLGLPEEHRPGAGAGCWGRVLGPGAGTGQSKSFLGCPIWVPCVSPGRTAFAFLSYLEGPLGVSAGWHFAIVLQEMILRGSQTDLKIFHSYAELSGYLKTLCTIPNL